jgi:hypothetical protein
MLSGEEGEGVAGGSEAPRREKGRKGPDIDVVTDDLSTGEQGGHADRRDTSPYPSCTAKRPRFDWLIKGSKCFESSGPCGKKNLYPDAWASATTQGEKSALKRFLKKRQVARKNN